MSTEMFFMIGIGVVLLANNIVKDLYDVYESYYSKNDSEFINGI